MNDIKYLQNYEVEQLWNEVYKNNSKHDLRNRAIFEITKYCALRVSEVGMIRIEDYSMVTRSIYCRREKRSLSNTIRILDVKVINALESYLEVREDAYPESKFLFVSQKGNAISRKTLDVIIKKYMRETKIAADKWHFHVLKHTRAVELGNMGLDIKDIQWWLGHKNINNTMIYMQFTTHQQESIYRKIQEFERSHTWQ